MTRLRYSKLWGVVAFSVAGLGSRLQVRPDLTSTGEIQWIIIAAGLVFCQYTAAIVLGTTVGFFSSFPTVKYMLIAAVISFVGGSVIVLPTIRRFWRQREQHPISRLLREADPSSVTIYLLGFQLVALQMGALTWLKEMLPAVAPYWADHWLASLDRFIFGVDAWRLVPGWVIPPLDIVYGTWILVHTITLISILCLRPSRLKAHAMLAYFLTVGLLGVCGQYLLSSAGPVFYDRIFGGNAFAGLASRIESHAMVTKMAEDFLWTSYSGQTGQIGNGISAMPSIHVATSTWIAISVSSLWPRLRVPVWFYWSAIFVGSFALGWHYSLDAAVGALGAAACWAIAARPFSRETQNSADPALLPIG